MVWLTGLAQGISPIASRTPAPIPQEGTLARPSRPLLSVDLIAATALALVDRTGDFTMAEVARALGVRPSSLYNHLTGREQIVEAMRTLVIEEPFEMPEVGDDPQERVRMIMRRYRESFARHPRLIPLLTSYTVSAPAVMRWYEELADQLAALGLQPDRLLEVITVFDSLVLGAALDLAAPEEVWDRAATENSALAAAIAASPVGRERADRAFELGLDLLLEGLRALHGLGVEVAT
jgi:AcrR family transcriptional regulator